MVGTGVRVCVLEGQGADRSASGQNTVVGLVHANLCGDEGGAIASGVCGASVAHAWTRAESEGGGEDHKGLEGPHGRLQGALEEGVIAVCIYTPGAGPVHGCHLFQGPLQGQGKQQRPKRVALAHSASSPLYPMHQY
jgi:hypothetical protein